MQFQLAGQIDSKLYFNNYFLIVSGTQFLCS